MLEQRNAKVYVAHAVMEKQIMTDLRHRNIVQVVVWLWLNVVGGINCPSQLHSAFQTTSKLYMLIDLCQGGTL